jgi:RRXRR protein
MSKGITQRRLTAKSCAMQFVPVVDFEQRPLMPTTPARAERWIKSGKATPFFRKGIFCVRLNVEPSNRYTQPTAVGIDPGSQREGYTVKSKAHTYLNQQFHAVDWVKDAEEASTNARRARRYRKTKLSNSFNAHCVDSWVLAYLLVGGDTSPENIVVMECKPIRIYRRQLHVFNPGKNGYRRPYGGSLSQGLKRGAIVKHPKYRKCYVGGEDAKKSRISLHSLGTGKRLCQNAKPIDCKFLAYNSWRTVKPS